jgi:hypothetical protein
MNVTKKEKLTQEIKSIRCESLEIENLNYIEGDAICICPLEFLNQLLHQQEIFRAS